jgi:CheY-like chemotaxis protein
MALSSNSAPPDAAPLANARILVVDDHAFTSGLVKDVLYANGAASVLSARDGAEALALLRTFNPDLVVTDWRMPGMDGLAFTRTVRRAELQADERIGNPQVPIILLSAHTSAEAVERARQAGVNEVVVKPFSIHTLVERLVATAANPRAFVVSDAYLGPDRRRRQLFDEGPRRRAGDRDVGAEITRRLTATSSLLKVLQKELDETQRGSRATRRKPRS